MKNRDDEILKALGSVFTKYRKAFSDGKMRSDIKYEVLFAIRPLLPEPIKAKIFKTDDGRYGLAVHTLGCDLCRWWDTKPEILEFCEKKGIEITEAEQ